MKQTKFYDRENDIVLGGIIDDDGNIICGCCGGLIEKDEISIKNCINSDTKIFDTTIKNFYKNDDKDCTCDIIEIYETWIDLTNEIIGN